MQPPLHMMLSGTTRLRCTYLDVVTASKAIVEVGPPISPTLHVHRSHAADDLTARSAESHDLEGLSVTDNR